VSQVLDYAAWVKELAYEDLATIFSNYEEQKKNAPSNPLETAFRDSFGIEIPEEININHEMVIVASELHPESERVVRYLQKNYGVPVNAVFFSFFKDGDAEYLSLHGWLNHLLAKSWTRQNRNAGMVNTMLPSAISKM